jgi:hypothetical protein
MHIDNNTKRLFFNWSIWFGAYIVIGLLLVLLLPFPYDLISVFGLCILMNFLRGWSLMKRHGGMDGIKDMFGSFSSFMARDDQNRLLKYYCMNCGKEHREIACPDCGSKMKGIG